MVVLIVCGNTASTVALTEAMTATGHAIVTAATGQRALDILKCNHSLDAVVVDRFIPDMSPADLLRAYTAYRDMQWPGCEASRKTPMFLLGHRSQSQDEFHGEVLDAIADGRPERV